MGFALWFLDGLAWAQGTHEYRPMGTAVLPVGGQFRHRDFSWRRRAPKRGGEGYAGLFASLEDLNRHLVRSRSQTKKKNLLSRSSRVLTTL
jgi:hypothetical protein